MNTRSSALLLLSVLSTPLALATGSDTHDSSGALQTGDYLQLATNAVYHYDTGTGIMAPTGQQATNVNLYYCAQAHARSETSTCGDGNTVGTCGDDLCGASFTAIVGSATVVHDHELTTSCGYSIGFIDTWSSAALYRYDWSHTTWDSWCSSMTLTVEVDIGGSLYAYSSKSV